MYIYSNSNLNAFRSTVMQVTFADTGDVGLRQSIRPVTATSVRTPMTRPPIGVDSNPHWD